MQDATTGNRCLARLCDLTSPSLLTQLWPIVLRIARLIAQFRSGEPSPEGMYQFERDLGKLLGQLGRGIVQWTINQIEPRDRDLIPRELFLDGDHYRFKRFSTTRNLNCLFGPIRLERALYEATEGLGLVALFPLELQLGLVRSIATPALADRVGWLASDLSQRQLLEVLRNEHQVHWGVQTLRKVTAATAEMMTPHRHAAQLTQVLTWLRQADTGSGPRRITLAVGRDGVMLPIIGSQKYREAATATLSVLDHYGKRLGTVYLGQMPQAGQRELSNNLTQLIQDVLSSWNGSPPRLVYVTDAGYHPHEYFTKVLSRMPDPLSPGTYLSWEWVVDYYHACGYIALLGEAIFGPGRAAHAWGAKMRRVLKKKPGGVFRLLRSAGALKSIRGLVGDEASYEKAYGYLRGHADWMKYDQLRQQYKPIGSGVTEAACKTLFTQRFKRAGMKWNVEDGRSILQLREIAISGVWRQTRHAMLASQAACRLRTPKRNAKESVKIA